MKKGLSGVRVSTALKVMVSALAIAAPAAHAQDAQQQSDSGQSQQERPASTSTGITEIVVTAQKRAENLQDVPISVTVIGGQQVENLHAVSLEGLQGSVPNVQIGSFSNTPQTAAYTIRGIGVFEPDPYAGNTVGIVVDGVPQFFSTGALLDLYDIDRIEILRGPQGTLFGANTTGGVVQVINTQPKMNEFSGKVDLGYGNHDHIQAAGALNIPLSEDLAGRFVGSHDRRDGWIHDVLGGDNLGKRNVTIFRGILRYEPTNDIDVSLEGEYDRSRNGAPVVINGAVPGEAEFVPEGFLGMYQSPCVPAGSRCEAPDTYHSAFNHQGAPRVTQDPVTGAGSSILGSGVDPLDDRSDMDNYRGTLTVNVNETGIGDITSITGYRNFTLHEDTDQDGTPVFLIDTRRRTEGWQLYQELRTNLDVTDYLNLLVGGSWLKTHYDHFQKLRINFAGGVTYNPDGTVTYGFPGFYQLNLQDQDNESFSAFAHSYIQLTEQLRLQAGIRYSHEKTGMLASNVSSVSPTGTTTFEGAAPDGNPNIPLPNLSATPLRGSESWNNVGWKIGLDYKPSDDYLIYGYWARGFKSGGFVGRIGIAEDLGPFGPEKVDTFEAGFKAEFLNNRVRTNFAAFYTNYRDIQLAQIYFVPRGPGVVQGNTILNAASSRIKGFEAELTAVPIDGLTLNGSLAYLSAKYKDFDYQLPDPDLTDDAPGPILDLSGQRMQNAPKWTSSVSATYEFPIAGMEGRLFAQYNYVSEKLLSSIVDTPRARVQPTHIVNANVDLMINDPLTVGVWATNLFDERYVNSALDLPGTFALVNYAAPRQYGVHAQVTF